MMQNLEPRVEFDVMDVFTDLLQGLGKIFSVHLQPDRNNACLIQINKTIQIQIQLDTTEENLILGSKVCTVLPGKFREDVLRNALEHNALPDSLGYLGFIQETNTLVLFTFVYFRGQSPEIIAKVIEEFLQVIISWKEAIASNTPGPIIRPVMTSTPPIFDIKP